MAQLLKAGDKKALDYYPPRAFFFSVMFDDTSLYETAFQEVSGIESEIEVETYSEGGENQFLYKLPKAVKHPNLVLKRAVAPTKSPLVAWCQKVLESGFLEPIEPKGLSVRLMNDSKTPIRTWSFRDAYPIKWSVDTFNSTKNELAIETLELAYLGYYRVPDNNIGPNKSDSRVF